MARFDNGSRLDRGLKFDEAEVPPITKRTTRSMNFFKLDLRHKSVDEKISLLQAHIAAMALPDALVKYPTATRKPSDARVAAVLASLIAAKAAADANETAWKASNTVRDAAEDEADAVLTARASDCEATTTVLADLIITALPLRGAAAPSGPIGAPQNFRATMGDMAGEMDLMCDANQAAASLTIKYREHLTTGDYIVAGSTTKSKFTVTGLISGKTYGFLAQFLGNDGPGPWSDEAVKMAP